MSGGNGKVDLARLLGRKPQRQEVAVVIDDETTTTFVFEAIAGAAYDALLIAHQPTDEQRDALGMGLGWDPTTFPAAVVAASLVEPQLSEDEVRQLFTSKAWSRGEVDQLVTAAILVNNRPRSAAVGKGSGTTPSSPPEPATP